MKKRATILMFTGLAIAALADNPEADSAFFHPAASLYIQGNAAGASNLVARGLAEFPDDGKLKRLKELLEQQQQNQQNQDQQQNDQQQEQQDPQQEQKQEDLSQNEQDQDPQDQADPQDQQQQPEPQRAEQMSQDEAERLLDAMKQEEKNKRLELHPIMGRPVEVDKDW